jgi:hypothetical protein
MKLGAMEGFAVVVKRRNMGGECWEFISLEIKIDAFFADLKF